MITMLYMHDFNKSFLQTLYQKSIDKKAEYNCIIFLVSILSHLAVCHLFNPPPLFFHAKLYKVEEFLHSQNNTLWSKLFVKK